MSACSDFAEHVWKPGSCKNCFHPLSAHHKTVGGRGGSAPPLCSKSSLGGDDEVAASTPYNKPTIAVRPTMMSLDNSESVTDVNMNIEQENTKSPVERLGLKKLLGLSSLYIDSNGLNKSSREMALKSPETKADYNNCLSKALLSQTIPPKESMIISNIFVTQEEGRGSQSLKKNATGDPCKQQNAAIVKTNSTYNGTSNINKANVHESQQAPMDIPLSVDPPSPAPAQGNDISSMAAMSTPAKTSCLSPTRALSADATSPNPLPSLNSPPVLSKQTSLSDSSCSYRSSTDSLPGADGSGEGQARSRSPQSPADMDNTQSAPNSPDGKPNSEPIYAESTKKKCRLHENGVPSNQESPNRDKNPSQCRELEALGESQRATITVLATHVEESNRTFYLSSPDSAISAQCHFSPTARRDPSSPAFRWPSPSRSAPSLSIETNGSPGLYPKPQCSPPIPPKRTTRSPKLGTSSLSPSMSSLVSLPELPKLGTSSLLPSMSSPVPLPELPMLFLVSAPEGHFKVHQENQGTVLPERWHKPHHPSPSWNCRIEEEEEEEEKERKEGEKKKKKKLAAEPVTSPRVSGPVNGAAVWKEAKDCKAHSSPPPATQPGTAPPAAANNGACQGKAKGTGAEKESKQNGSMPARQPLLHGSSSELLAAAKGSASHEPNPPPPPPKKLHRASGKMSGSNAELDRCSQQGSLESSASTSSLRALSSGLSSGSFATASTDSLTTDTAAGSRDAARLSCSSPFSRSPAASAPGSPHPPSSGSFTVQPPPLPEKKLVNRTASAPDTSGRAFVPAFPRLPFAGSESSMCRPAAASRSSLPSSPVDTRSMFSSSESLERCPGPQARPARSRTLDEPLKTPGRLGVHCRTSITCSSSPQLNAPFSAPEPGLAPGAGSSLQLQTLLSNIDNREGVYSKLGGLYAESLRRLALKCEDHFTRSQRNPLRFEESNWSLFRLTSNKPCCNAGDAVYYSAACASDPSNSYAVKISKGTSVEARQAHLYGLSVQQSVPPHFNLQQDCGHFLACVPHSMSPSDEAAAAAPATHTAAVPHSPPPPPPPLPPPPPPPPPPQQQQQQQQQQQADRERVVVITSEVPQQTAADFVREWAAFHKAQPEVYERRVCFLLLQLCNGLEHLKEHGVTHRDLCLENLLLVPHHRRPPPPTPQQQQQRPPQATDSNGDVQRQLPRLLISNFAKSKRRCSEDAAAGAGDARVKRDHARLAPEIVSAAQYRKFDEFQAGILIYELLHQPNPFEVRPALREQDYRCEDLPPIPPVSLYSAGLQRLAQLLLQPDPIKRIHIQEAKRALQSLLWGPRRDLMEQQAERRGGGGGGGGASYYAGASRHEGLLNWLDVKRALLMMKFAERSLEPERNAELEDWLCCQYFSSAHPLALCHTAELLYALK